MKTYSISKICAEAVVRFAAREFNLPTIICRLNSRRRANSTTLALEKMAQRCDGS